MSGAPVPPLSRDRLVLGGAGLLLLGLLLPALLSFGGGGPEIGFALGWATFTSQGVGAVVLGGGLVVRELARREARAQVPQNVT